MPGLLYPAFQKFYSAISCLERFEKEQDFFANISSLDTFFSEYRSITLVMQKSLAHTPYFDTYKKKVAEGIFDPWFNEQRIKSVHTHPAEFSKTIDISVYFPDKGFHLLSESFTVENDTPLSTLTDALKAVLRRFNPTEVFFSAKYSFPEKDSGEDMLKRALAGIETMQAFMDFMYQSVEEKCFLCDRLREKIRKSKILHMPMDFLLIDDYVYYPDKDRFEKAGRLAMILGDSTAMRRYPLSGWDRFSSIRKDDYFQKFVAMHIVAGVTEFMPAIMTVYSDNTFSLDVFHADIKTTFYRKLNETADRVLTEDVREVYLMTVYTYCDYSEENLQCSSRERLAHSTAEFLAFMKVNADLEEEEYTFEKSELKDRDAAARRLLAGPGTPLDFGAGNMAPVIEAFRKKKAVGEDSPDNR